MEEGRQLQFYLMHYSNILDSLKEIEKENKEAAELLTGIEDPKKDFIANN